jgi:hypothetical protein
MKLINLTMNKTELRSNIEVEQQTAGPEPSDRPMILRGEIDIIDEKLLSLLAQRMRLVNEIGRYKK